MPCQQARAPEGCCVKAARRRPDAFTINHAAPRIDVRTLQVTANLRAGSAKGVETRRAVILASRHGGVYARAVAVEGTPE